MARQLTGDYLAGNGLLTAVRPGNETYAYSIALHRYIACDGSLQPIVTQLADLNNKHQANRFLPRITHREFVKLFCTNLLELLGTFTR